MDHDETDREWADRHQREHENPFEFPDCEQCQVELADRRHEQERNMRDALAMDPRQLRQDRYCVQDIGLNADCADPAYEKRGGFWYCDRHAAGFDADVRAGEWADEQEAAGWHTAQPTGDILFELSPGYRITVRGL